MKTDPINQANHRFFHTMVVIGGSLAAAGCGKLYTDEKSDSDGDGKKGEGSSSGADGADSSQEGSGGAEADDSVYLGSGGAIIPDMIPPKSIDEIEFPAIGQGGAGSIDECPIEQLHCDSSQLSCTGEAYGYHEEMISGCHCEPDSPTSLADCEESEQFVCQVFTIDGEGANFVEPQAFGCRCLASEESCESQCEALPIDPSQDSQCFVESEGTVLCGCGWVILVK